MHHIIDGKSNKDDNSQGFRDTYFPTVDLHHHDDTKHDETATQDSVGRDHDVACEDDKDNITKRYRNKYSLDSVGKEGHL